jgi:dihydroorotate dehydrogenase electron transfer subunit
VIQTDAELIDRQIAGAAQELRMRAPQLARQLCAGQPVLVRTAPDGSRLLRRTFYPIAIDDETWTLRLQPSGDWGHAWLRTIPLGSAVDCLGPVGTGYSFPPGIRNVLFAGQGESAWALLPLILLADSQGLAVTLAVEGNRALDLVPAQRLPRNAELHVATLDGSAGRQGRLAPMLPQLLSWADCAMAAGSLDFYDELIAAVEAARFGLRSGFAQILYPASFLCGTGACQACTADVAGGRRRVCLRGPVFDLTDLRR